MPQTPSPVTPGESPVTPGESPVTPGEQDQVPRWLDDAEREAWLSIIRVASKLPSALDDQLQRDAGVNFFEYTVLAMLSERPDRVLRMSHLAAVTNSSLSRLSHVAKRLEAKGLMRRELDPSDGRCTNAILTDAGLDLVERTAPRHVAAVRDLVIDVVSPAQLRQVRQANERILARVDPDATTRPLPLTRPGLLPLTRPGLRVTEKS